MTEEMNTFDLIKSLRSMKIGEERLVDGHMIKRIDKHHFRYVCSCCIGREIAYGKK